MSALLKWQKNGRNESTFCGSMIVESRPGGRLLGDMVAGKPEGNTHQGRGGAGCEIFWHLQENSSFCRNVEVKGGIIMNIDWSIVGNIV